MPTLYVHYDARRACPAHWMGAAVIAMGQQSSRKAPQSAPPPGPRLDLGDPDGALASPAAQTEETALGISRVIMIISGIIIFLGALVRFPSVAIVTVRRRESVSTTSRCSTAARLLSLPSSWKSVVTASPARHRRGDPRSSSYHSKQPRSRSADARRRSSNAAHREASPYLHEHGASVPASSPALAAVRIKPLTPDPLLRVQ